MMIRSVSSIRGKLDMAFLKKSLCLLMYGNDSGTCKKNINLGSNNYSFPPTVIKHMPHTLFGSQRDYSMDKFKCTCKQGFH